MGKVWRSDVILTSTDIKVEAIGCGKKIRGRKHRNWRPDLIVCDDLENDENVRTPEQRKKLADWFYKAVSKAGDDYTDIIYIGTLLHYDSLLAKILKNPSYQSVKYKAVISFSKRTDLWDSWEEIYTDLANDNREQEALDFFELFKEDMLEGTEVLWEDKLTYYDLMVMKVSEGDASFNSEEQNEPINPDDCMFNPEWFDYYNEVEIDFKDQRFDFIGFVDPSLGKNRKSDLSTIICIAKDKMTGYMYILISDIDRRHPDVIITDILNWEVWLRNTYGRGFKIFGCETNQFQWFLKEELAKASAKAGLYLPIEEVNQTGNKVMRIQTLQPDIKNRYIKFNPKHKKLIEYVQFFPMAANDDPPDALEACRTLSRGGGKGEVKYESVIKRLFNIKGAF
jgi:predicted phage terminase large subunit-like protein